MINKIGLYLVYLEKEFYENSVKYLYIELLNIEKKNIIFNLKLLFQ